MTSPCSSSRSAPYWRSVSSRRYRVRVSSRLAVTIDLSTSEANKSSRSSRSAFVSAQTASAAGRSNPPANTESRSKSRRSSSLMSWYDQSTVARSVRWCAVLPVPLVVKRRNRSSRRSRMSPGVSDRTRAAASSIASGTPSRRLQMASIVDRSTSSGLKDSVGGRCPDTKQSRGVRARIERGNRLDPFADQPEWLPTRGQHRDSRAARHHGRDQLTQWREHVFAVVEDQEELPTSEPVHD